jgi:hypothetical protein
VRVPRDPFVGQLLRQELIERPNNCIPERQAATAPSNVVPKSSAKPKPLTFPESDHERGVRMRAMNRSPAMRASRSLTNKARGFAVKMTPAVIEKLKLARAKRGPVSDEVKAKISASMVKLLMTGFPTVSLPLVSTKQEGDKKFVRSSYEVKFVEYMEGSSEVVSFKYEPIAIKYRNKHTVPDFLVTLVTGERVLVEVKAAWFVRRCKKKMQAAEYWANANGMRYIVLTEHELFD